MRAAFKKSWFIIGVWAVIVYFTNALHPLYALIHRYDEPPERRAYFDRQKFVEELCIKLKYKKEAGRFFEIPNGQSIYEQPFKAELACKAKSMKY